MCGIFGAVGRPIVVDSLRVDAAVSSMGHRGPDASGVWASRRKGQDEHWRCTFGHTRLSIIDLSPAGGQPMSTEDGRYTIVYNGEVYNFREIRNELEGLGERFVSTCDTEVVLKAYARFGRRCLTKFRGMFAFGIWDEQEGGLFLARDRLGVKPLYVCEKPGYLAFASEVRTLLTSRAAGRDVSLPGLLDYLRYGSVCEPETMLADVTSLPPGTFLWKTEDRREVESYWRLPEGDARRVSKAEAVTETGRLLRESVRMRLVSDVPFGIFLSGGVDSSALLALASEAAAQPIYTFTVVFDEAEFSEEKHAGEVAGFFGSRHEAVHLSGARAAGDLPLALMAQDQPSADGLNTFYVTRAARAAGLSMALSGLGGDELFAGYHGFQEYRQLRAVGLLGRAVPDSLLGLAERALAGSGVRNRLRKAMALICTNGAADAVYRVMRQMFTDAQIRSMLTGPTVRNLDATGMWSRLASVGREESGGVEDAVNLLTRQELSGYLRNTLLRDTDMMSMASALEVRVPYLDHELVSYVSGLPGRMKLKRGSNKPLLLAAVPGLPEGIGSRAKVGFVLPLGHWFRGPMRTTMEGLVRDVPGPSGGLLRRPILGEMWQSFLRGDGGITPSRIWGIASLNHWLQVNRVVLPW